MEVYKDLQGSGSLKETSRTKNNVGATKLPENQA
jgi:hypothetical protein